MPDEGLALDDEELSASKVADNIDGQGPKISIPVEEPFTLLLLFGRHGEETGGCDVVGCLVRAEKGERSALRLAMRGRGK